MFQQPEIIDVMRKVCDYQLQALEQGEGTPRSDINFEWIRGAFFTGELACWRATGDSVYLEEALRWGESKNWQLDIPDTRHADWQCCGQVYLELYLKEKDPRMLAGIRQNVDRQMADEKLGREDWWWCDALYMAPPMLALLYAATGETRYLDFLNRMYWDSWEHLFDPSENLFYRDHNYFDAKTRNGQKVFWSRGNGWVLGGLARLMDHVPSTDPAYEKFVDLFRRMSARLAALQPPDGLWRPSLLDTAEFPAGETSGTAFFVFAMAWGINQGLLARADFEPVVWRGWNGLRAAINEKGRLGYVQTIAAAPGPVSPDGTKEYASGALLLAGEQLCRLVMS